MHENLKMWEPNRPHGSNHVMDERMIQTNVTIQVESTQLKTRFAIQHDLENKPLSSTDDALDEF